ncbi:MAG: ATP-binding protein [Leptospiraceae bacterium]|nr:ATP-binding protein [Leptospiraceae bacterium]MCP5513383.1 ATP-binding protein [Leptospiraceae bacterium]
MNEQIIKPEDRKDIKALKAALIFGANASGKSNFIKAMFFAQKLILKGGIDPVFSENRKVFRFDEEYKHKPSEFSFVFKKDQRVFDYSIKIDEKFIIEEKLIEIKKKSEDLIFHRNTNTEGKVSVRFDDFRFKSKEDKKRIEYIAKDTLSEKLFLYELNTRNLIELGNSELFTLPFQWFRENLIILFPESTFLGLELKIKENQDIEKLFTNFLEYFDTGISGIEIQEIEIEKLKEKVSLEVYNKILEEIQTKDKIILNLSNSLRYAIAREEGLLKSFKLMTKHSSGLEKEVLFDFSEESDGTRRLFDLIPGLLSIRNLDRTIVIDEIDRSLHPILTRKLLELFFEVSQNNESQLITCTHESILLDQKLLRKDEVWFVEKNNLGESSIYSLEEFPERYDKDIQKGYLLGRFGAVAAIHKKKLVV